jgi:cyclase
LKKRLPRIIPLLLYQNGGLVKTVNFKNPTYIGDPINAVRIYNEMEADELIFIDIDSTVNNKPINFQLIENIANEAFMPVCYGGGIKNIDSINKIIGTGVEKVCISSAFFENEELIKQASEKFGSQSIVVCLDIKKDKFDEYSIYTHNGKYFKTKEIEKTIKKITELGAGELLINNIDREGTMMGFDLSLIKEIRKYTDIQFIASGGAGKLIHLKEAIQSSADAVSAGSLFVYYGKLNGILINYPKRQQLLDLFFNEVQS